MSGFVSMVTSQTGKSNPDPAASNSPDQNSSASSSASSTAQSGETEEPPSRLGSSFWSSWISPSSSSAVAASSAMEKRNKPKRPTFEEFRAQEPPQARLIRLRGLFDTLLDEDDETALAGGRAREEWIKSARRARYGAGGSLARGSLAPSDIRNSTVGFEEFPETKAASSKTESDAQEKLLPPPPPPRTSYAKELLIQFRQCREEIESQRAKQVAQDKSKDGDGWGWNVWGWSSDGKEAEAESKYGASSTLASVKNALSSSSSNSVSDSAEASSSSSSIAPYFGWGSSSSSSSPSSETSDAHLHPPADLEHEAGWTGSGVWGLSAVGHKRRAADRLRDEKVKKGHQVKDDGGARKMQIEWEGFLAYAEHKERELYNIFSELDKNGDMRLDSGEIRTALDRAGLVVPQVSLDDFVASLTCSRTFPCRSEEKAFITFPEFRDYLLLLPRKPSVPEIFRFYQVRKAFGLFGIGGIFAEIGAGWGTTERGATAVNSDGDVSLAGVEKKKESPAVKEAKKAEKRQEAASAAVASAGTDESNDKATLGAKAQAAAQAVDEEEDDSDMIQGSVALKFLVAGGIAGAVSRTATAPFDRLKIYLITMSARAPPTAAQLAANPAAAGQGIGLLREALTNVYRDGGLKAFWLGNGLNCLKIFPESAIKFLSYEMSKRAFAKYVDHVSDSRDISGTSRFLSGGIGGITSQLAIYPVETLKTRLMSSQGGSQTLKGNALLVKTAKDMWRAGALRAYYRGLTAGLIGVFPYSAIDMSTFEGIKLFYIKYSGKEEPGVLALLSFGSVSGSVGATTVYPLKTRLQASGTPAHPTLYNGFWDAVGKTYSHEGVRGFYRGLVPTLAKVIPAVSISYVVYEQSKRRLGVT